MTQMFIGILQFELLVHGSTSLKDKRRVVRSVKDRLHREHMVSVAEVGALDHQQVAMMGLSVVAGSSLRAGQVLDKVVEKLRRLHDAELGHHQREIVQGETLTLRAVEEDDTGPDERARREAEAIIRDEDG